jgi:dolichyl-phosphate beta-glucosyltransferase
MPKLSVVIPAYDEAERLPATLPRIYEHLRRRGEPFEMLVVDDGSRDRTAEAVSALALAEVLVIRHPTNRGKGAAVRTGVLASQGDWVLLTDADLSTPIEDLDRLWPHVERADLVFGSRAAAGSAIGLRQPFHRELMGKVFNRVVRLLGVRGLRDTQCGFKLLPGATARELFRHLTIDRFAYDVELVWLARRRGLSVVEVGVRWENSAASHVRLLQDSLLMLLDVVRFRLHHRRHGAG